MMKQRLIDAASAAALMWWDWWTFLGGTMRPLGYAVSYRIAQALDGDSEPCASCEASGGTHVDCDLPAAGRMTKTERKQAFGETKTIPPGRVTWYGYGKRWYGTATGKIHDEGLGAYAVVDPDNDAWGSRLVLLSHVHAVDDIGNSAGEAT